MRSIVIASFSVWKNNIRTPYNGMIEPLLSYFLPRCKRLYLIDGTHPGSSTTISIVETYANSLKIKTSFTKISQWMSIFLKTQNVNGTQIFFKIRDFLSTIELIISNKSTVDIFIGLECIYTLAAIILKYFKLIHIVVYYVSDYAPNRFGNTLFNNIYLTLDRFCCYNADFIWDVSSAMHPARIKAGLDPERSKIPIIVPNALFPKQICIKPLTKIQKYTLVFAGSLGEENGPELAIDSVALLKNKIPNLQLHFYGAPEKRILALKSYVMKLDLKNHVYFHDSISNLPLLSKTISHYYIALAPYRTFANSVRWYADATKMRLYFGAGLPVITTKVPPLGKITEKINACIIADDTPEKFSNAIHSILIDNGKYNKMRQAAVHFSKSNTWENSYNKAFEEMSITL